MGGQVAQKTPEYLRPSDAPPGSPDGEHAHQVCTMFRLACPPVDRGVLKGQLAGIGLAQDGKARTLRRAAAECSTDSSLQACIFGELLDTKLALNDWPKKPF